MAINDWKSYRQSLWEGHWSSGFLELMVESLGGLEGVSEADEGGERTVVGSVVGGGAN